MVLSCHARRVLLFPSGFPGLEWALHTLVPLRGCGGSRHQEVPTLGLGRPNWETMLQHIPPSGSPQPLRELFAVIFRAEPLLVYLEQLPPRVTSCS